MSNFKKNTITGIIWSVSSRSSKIIFSFVTIVILARLLSPEEFGLIAMISVLIQFANIFAEFGFSEALIQKHNVKQELLSSVFWINILIGFLLTLIFIFLSKFISQFYQRPELELLTKFVSLTFIIQSLSIVQNALLRKKLKFNKIFIVEFLSTFVYGVSAISMAFYGFGVWSIAISQVLSSTMKTILFWIVNKWRPSLQFNISSIKEISNFSLFLLGTRITQYWSRHIDDLLIGRVLGAVALGIYDRAYSVLLFPLRNISSVISRVLFPSLSIIKDEKARIRNIYLKTIGSISIITFPLMLAILAVSDSFVIAVFGQKWIGMAPVLRIFCFLGIFQSISNLNGSIYLSQGKTNIQFKLSLVFTFIVTIGIIIGLRWGAIGVAYGYSAASIILTFFGLHYVSKLIDLKLTKLLKAIVPNFVCSIIMAASIKLFDILVLSNYAHMIRILINIPVAFFLYLALIHTFKLDSYVNIKKILKEQLIKQEN